MAKLLTPIESGSATATAGERRFAERLKDLLEDDYLCWFNVPVGTLRQYPDFVLLHPSRGLWVFEVKDWRVEIIKNVDKHKFEIHTGDAIKSVANPLEQARQYCMTIVNRLGTDPQLRHSAGSHKGKICFPYAYAVVLSNITRKQFDEILSEEEQELVLPGRLVICKDEMTENTPADQFQERLWGMFHYAFGEKLSLPQIDRVRWHLFPEIRITSVQRDFFSDPETEQETTPDFIQAMDLVQEQLARNLGKGHRVIHGVAGSGKTLILGYRCLQLAKELHKPILVLCFNITLASRLRSFIEQRNLQDKVVVQHFHGWCKQQLETFHSEIINPQKAAYEHQVESVIHGVEKGFIPRAQYGAILIDEGHDFAPEWLKLITQMLDPETDSLLLLYDDAQSIYRNNSGLKFSLSAVGIKAQGRTTILRLNYRNTREILQFAKDFAVGFLEEMEADEDHIPQMRPEAAGPSGHKPAFYQFPSRGEEIRYALTCVEHWQKEGKPLNEIALICMAEDYAEDVRDLLKETKIPVRFMGNRHGKINYNPKEARVSIMWAPSSKGLEFDCVIILGAGSVKTEGMDQVRLTYVAITRARQQLLLTSSTSNPITERLAALTS